MQHVPGAGWLHEPIEGCEQATASQDSTVRAHHTPHRTEGARLQENDQRVPKAFLDGDEDAFKMADP